MNRIVIFHADCADGFCAAWVVATAMPADERAETRFVPARYGDPLPEGIDGAEVIVLDFSYPLPLSLELRRRALAFWQLDHHKSAEEEHRVTATSVITDDKGFVFDQSRSGARLAWDHLACGSEIREGFEGYDRHEDRHWLVEYVQDRDLWRWELPDSRAVSAAIGALPMRGPEDFEAWTDFACAGVYSAVGEGRVILAANERYVEKAAARAGRGLLNVSFTHPLQSVGLLQYDGIPIVNTTHLTSEVLERLAVGHPFAVGWLQTSDGVFHYSLRSAEGGSDVSEIARGWGGGGHPRAAGFESRSIVHEMVKS